MAIVPGQHLRIGPAIRRCAIGVAAATVLSFTTLATAGAAPKAGPGDLNDKAAAQISALQQIKLSETSAEQKLDSKLVVAERQRAGQSITTALPKLATGVTQSKLGLVAVDITVTSVSPGLLARLASLGAEITSKSTRLSTLRVAAPLGALIVIASWSDVRHVSLAVGAITAHETQSPATAGPAETKAHRAARVDGQLTKALTASAAKAALKPATVSQGSVVSEGDKAEAANKARANFKVTGFGVKVCVLSDGIDSLAASQASGDMPAVDVLPDQEGSGDEGTAMLEIIHDLAPNAALGFATAIAGDS
jgi:hypothetical protein